MFIKYDKTEYEKHIEELGECLGYVEMACINCGRHRVEKYNNGALICEKCSYDQNKKSYDLLIHEYI